MAAGDRSALSDVDVFFDGFYSFTDFFTNKIAGIIGVPRERRVARHA